MSLTILSVAYPLARVSPDSTGGSEQVLGALDRAIVAAGHRSIVVAPEGSRVGGSLEPIPARDGVLDEAAKAAAQTATRDAIARVLARERVDVVHLHGIDFDRYLPPPGPPVLATLHLPPDWYAPGALHPARPRTVLNCVSAAQHAACPASAKLVDPIENGVPVERLAARHAKREFALFLGASAPRRACTSRSKPRRGPTWRCWWRANSTPTRRIGPMSTPRSARVSTRGGASSGRSASPANAACSRRRAASSCRASPPKPRPLVVREAAACGTPAIAFPNGALAEAIIDGETGFLVADAAAMAAAIPRAGAIDPDRCRAVARDRFDEAVMAARYLDLYRRLAGGLA